MWGLFLLSIAAAYVYMQNREKVFPVPNEQYHLDQVPSKEDVLKLVAPYVQLEGLNLKYAIDTFVDRNAVKFLQKTIQKEDFQNILEQENIPLWGWIVQIQKPFQANVKISHQKKLIGFEMLSGPEFLKPSNRKDLLLNLQLDLHKELVRDDAQMSNLILQNELRFQRQVPNSELMETINITFDHNNLTRMESNLLLPVAYADLANADIQKQKTLHQFFNIFHYILIALIFLFLFRTYENHLLPWKKNIPIFAALYLSHFFNYFLDSSSIQFLTVIQSLVKAFGSSCWLFALIVAADLVARTYSKSSYSLSDIPTKKFFASHWFRESLVFGWILFVGQLVFVGLFYAFYQKHAAYVPLKIPGEHSIYQSYEFLKYFFDSFSTSIYEETLYRLFLICIFVSAFKKTWPAVLISSVLWGFLHFSYQFDPFYIRGLELTLVGLAYGFFMVRYGILSVIFAHFLYNSFVLSEYENQFAPYLTGVVTLISVIYIISYLMKSKTETFQFNRLELPASSTKSVPETERRNVEKRIYPLNWKYGIAILAIVLIIIFRVPTPEHDTNPLANRDKLILASSKLISAYGYKDTWNVTYNLQNSEINKIREKVLELPDRKKLINEVNFYAYLWGIRYFNKPDTKTICEFDYSRDYDLVKLVCPYTEQSLKLSFDDWVRRVKKPDETWTLFNIKPFDNGTIQYQYTIEKELSSPIQRSAHLTFQNNQLIHFKKQTDVIAGANKLEPAKKRFDLVSVALSIALLGILYGFVKFFLSVVKVHSFTDRKPLYAALLTCFVYTSWKLNAYKEFLLDLTDALSWKHLMLNELMMFGLKFLVLGFVSYFLFYAFIYFPAKTFQHIPSSKDWNGILKRPVWKWRNTKVGLLFATLLICIQTLLRLLIQINNGMPELDLFHFDVSYLNHEFIFITFIGLFWKNLLFWVLLMVVISILEKYIPRWIYLSILCVVVFANIWFSNVDLNSKLIELCGIYIVFYFVYNVARFDFAFYFWFILLNTLTTFLPLVLYKQFSSYLVQMLLLFIFVLMLMTYTVFQKTRVLKLK